MGSVPRWYLYVRAARYLRVPVWDLIEQPPAYMEMALQAEQAEIYAAEQKRKHDR